MIIRKGAQVWYWSAKQGASVPAVIYRVASTGAGNAFAAVNGTTLDLNVAGQPTMLRAVPFVAGVPTTEQLSGGFCSGRPYVPAPRPLTFDEALAQVKAGKTATRAGVTLTPADVAASDWAAS